MTMRLKLLSLILFCHLSASSAFNWSGHIVRANGGFVCDDLRFVAQGGVPKAALQLTGNAALFYGYEFGHQFQNRFYIGGSLEWIVGFPRNFLPNNQAVLPRWQLWLQPLTHVRAGYVFPNDMMLSLGITYLWGLTLNLRTPLGEYFFLEAQWLQWLDGITNLYQNVGLPPGLASAIDLFNVSAGIGYRF